MGKKKNKLIRRNIHIEYCDYCGKHFIPKSDSKEDIDEHYFQLEAHQLECDKNAD